jgi:hypothetical protein
MHGRLRNIYFALLAPAIIGFIAMYLFRPFHQAVCLAEHHMAIVAPAIFILAAVFAIAGPIFYRSIFTHRQRNLARVPQAVLFKFERNLTCMTEVVPYLALVGHFLQLPRFYLSATLLMALYAVYYYYPSRKRIAFDRKMFRTIHAS